MQTPAAFAYWILPPGTHGAADWPNSTVLRSDLAAEVRARKQAQDIVVMGSASVTRALMASDLVDEYRLMVFPIVIGSGKPLFDGARDTAAERTPDIASPMPCYPP